MGELPDLEEQQVRQLRRILQIKPCPDPQVLADLSKVLLGLRAREELTRERLGPLDQVDPRARQPGSPDQLD